VQAFMIAAMPRPYQPYDRVHGAKPARVGWECLARSCHPPREERRASNQKGQCCNTLTKPGPILDAARLSWYNGGG